MRLDLISNQPSAMSKIIARLAFLRNRACTEYSKSSCSHSLSYVERVILSHARHPVRFLVGSTSLHEAWDLLEILRGFGNSSRASLTRSSYNFRAAGQQSYYDMVHHNKDTWSWLILSLCTYTRIRTETGMFLRHVPLPLGYIGSDPPDRLELSFCSYQEHVIAVILWWSNLRVPRGIRTPMSPITLSSG